MLIFQAISARVLLLIMHNMLYIFTYICSPGPGVTGDRLMALALLGSQLVRGARASSLLFWVLTRPDVFYYVTHSGNKYRVHMNMQGY